MSSPVLHLRDRQINLSIPVVMGVLNVTPDSFSDGSNLGETTSASGFIVSINKVLARAREMIEQGARFLDIGGESTRPGAEPVSHQEELERVIPAIEAIRANFDVFISVDTSSPVVMSAALQAGAVMVNDVRALRRDGALDLVSKSGAAACLMHMQGEPKTMQEQVTYKSVVDEVMHFLAQRIHAAEQAGIARERLVIDPGFGFGKSSQHNYSLLGNLARLQVLGLPVLVGISRKSMIGQATGRAVEQRLAGGVAATACALQGGAKIIRSHDVAATVDAIRVHCALREAWTQETE